MSNKTTEWQFGDYIDSMKDHVSGDLHQTVRYHERKLLYEFTKYLRYQGIHVPDEEADLFIDQWEDYDGQ